MTAATAVARAIAEGLLQRADEQPCRACGGRASMHHHASYAKGMELVVIPVCDPCHGRIHHAWISDPGTGLNWCRVCRSSMGCEHKPGRRRTPVDEAIRNERLAVVAWLREHGMAGADEIARGDHRKIEAQTAPNADPKEPA